MKWLLATAFVLNFISAQESNINESLNLCDALGETEFPIGTPDYLDGHWQCTWHPATQEDNNGPDGVSVTIYDPINEQNLQLLQTPQMLLDEAEKARASGATVETISEEFRLDCGSAELATVTISGGDMEHFSTGEAAVHCSDRIIYIQTFGSYYTLQLEALIRKIEVMWPLSKE